MQLTLEFLQACLPNTRTEIRRTGKAPLSYRQLNLLAPGSPHQPDILYFFPHGKPENLAEKLSLAGCGIVWTDSLAPPPTAAEVLWIREVREALPLFSEISSIFFFFQGWSQQVQNAVIEKKPLDELCGLLSQVTSNPWYLADASFRIQAISYSLDVAELSVIWKFMCSQHHVPMDTILKLAESGKLEKMNHIQHAYIEEASPFNFPYVSKTIFSSQGIIGHFFIIGVYNKISAYEKELAEFFGNLLNQQVEADSTYMPTLGRYYDNYFIDLIEGSDSADRKVLPEVFRRLSWTTSDLYTLIVFQSPMAHRGEAAIDGLKIQVLEKMYPCKAFPYQNKIAVILNASQLSDRSGRRREIQKMVLRILRDFEGAAGCSQLFEGDHGFESLNVYYQQALVALDFAQSQAKSPMAEYGEVALPYLCQKLSEILPAPMFCHPGMDILRHYDMENHTDLENTLYQYILLEQNTAETARQLFIHRNSLLYRLDKIQALTNLRLENPGDRVRILLDYLYHHVYDRPAVESESEPSLPPT